MWKYTTADEMYHSLTGKSNSTELYHSDVYLGQDYSDGIRHFKYTYKKKGPDGKWRYYYQHKLSKNVTGIYQKTSGNPNSKYGVYEHGPGFGTGEKHTVKKGKSLLTKTRVTGGSIGRNGAKTVYKTTEVGLIRQGTDKAVAKVKKALKKLKNKVYNPEATVKNVITGVPKDSTTGKIPYYKKTTTVKKKKKSKKK